MIGRSLILLDNKWISDLHNKYNYCEKIEFLPFPSATPELLQGYIIHCSELNEHVDLNKCILCKHKTGAIWKRVAKEQNYKKYCLKCDCAHCSNECDKCINCDYVPVKNCDKQVRMK